ncbi:uncharacterized protein LOC117645228 [Thrips palmi]|uniref:Uncharacterized protein LOC117645228 n=1 Tax=Thrips palmi TaxID=161013 RepID=A0A6P8YMI2_THRPL|nr:uncharacterized protein LOC117645228 [Thrips palmi]
MASGTRANNKQAEEISEKTLQKIIDKVYEKYKAVIDEQQVTVKNLSDEVQKLREVNAKLNDEIEKLQLAADNATRRFDELEQYGRRNNLRIWGIKESAGEDVDKLVVDMARKIGANIDGSCLDRAHRVGRPSSNNKPRPIIVKFTSYAHRREMWKNKRALKGSPVSIAEDLTRARAALLYKVNNTYPRKTVWTSDGVILVKYNDTVLRMVTEEDLDEAYRRYPPIRDS